MDRVWLALLAEAVGAFILMWAVMGTAVNPDAPKGVAPWAIGGALGLAVLIFGPATGGSFNPARWFGPALVSNTWSDGWLYIIGPVLGAGIAAFSYISIMEASHRIAGAAAGAGSRRDRGGAAERRRGAAAVAACDPGGQ